MSATRWVVAGLIACGLLIVGTYVHARNGLLPLDKEARARAPGSFVELSDGQVHYEWHGPADGSVTVMIHGFSTPSFVWAGLLPPLTGANMRVLSYDNYGRGFSDRPDTTYDAALFDRQLMEILAAQGIEEPIDLVGYSMGGGIATYFTANHPERVRRLALIAPVGFPLNAGSAAQLIRLPLLGDWLTAVVGRSTVLSMMELPENQGKAIPDLAERYQVQMTYEGYLRALLSTMRHYPMAELEAEYKRIGSAGTPVLAIWGDLDSTVPPENAKQVVKAAPQTRVEMIIGGTHAITYSESEQVSAALISFFTQPDSAPSEGPAS
ncbi:MAG: alpha/beta hydrolase [Deltaproteobacteria bacterium]|nr:alpha/beta hydrolase [Deltaproteobacteria bacterium]